MIKSISSEYSCYYHVIDDSMIVKAFDKLPQDSKNIRETVFVDEQGFNEEFDTVDNRAIHFVVYLNGIPVGTCRMFTEDDASAFLLGRLAVLSEYRGRDIGSTLVREAENFARQNGGVLIKLHSQCRAKEFYLKCGYNEYGEIEYEEHCPHIWMNKTLAED